MDCTKDKQQKKEWTDEERLELSKRLDKELDEYIDGLERRPYQDGWDENKWQEEFSKHPFFMTEMPKDGSDVSPLLEGLQQLKYGEDDNTPDELANSYKDDGNWNFKYKKFKLAILCYTKGILYKPQDCKLKAQLFHNRALAQLRLQNYRSALIDSLEALKLHPEYEKALHTAAKCTFHIKNYDECMKHCDKILEKDPNDSSILQLKTNAIREKKIIERNARLEKVKEAKNMSAKQKVISKINKLGINIDKDTLFVDQNYSVYLDNENVLVWPAVIFYPENKQSDFIQHFSDTVTLSDQLQELFIEPPAWDTKDRYKVENINIYFVGKNETSKYKVDTKLTLREILQHKEFYIKDGTPVFFCLVAGSEEEKSFLNSN